MATRYEENRSRARLSLGLCIWITVLMWVATGCGGETPTPSMIAQAPIISEPKVGATTPLKPGEEAGISVDVSSVSGATLTYEWHADGGEIVRGDGSPAITYRAPDEPGVYNVRVVVEWNGQSVEKTTSIQVEEEPTPTDTPTPTNTFTPTPTDTPTPTPTDTPTPTNTFTPTPACESFRPQIRDAADFAGEVEITTPEDCTTNLQAETMVVVAGTYDGIPEDVDMWVLVCPPNMAYFPQSPNACEGAKMDWGNGKWQVPVYLGAKGGDPEWHDIVVVLVDQEASQAFSDRIREGCQAGGYLGFAASELEEMNITEKTHITVQTQD